MQEGTFHYNIRPYYIHTWGEGSSNLLYISIAIECKEGWGGGGGSR